MDQTEYNKPPFEEDSLDIKKYLFKILFNWYWFAISIFIALAAAYVVNRYTTPIYDISATLIVRDDTRGSQGIMGAGEFLQGMEMFRNTKNIQNEMGILKSWYMANKTLQELDFGISYVKIGRSRLKKTWLYDQCPFKVIPDSSGYTQKGYPVYISIISRDEYRVEIDEDYNVNRVLKFGEKFEHPAFNFSIRIREGFIFSNSSNYSYYFVVNSLNSLCNQYSSKLNIAINDKYGSLLTLSIQGYNAQQETDYLNKLCEVFIRSGLDEKNQIAANTINFIDEQLKVIADSLQSAEISLQNFRTKESLINLSSEGSAIMTRLEKFESEKSLLLIKDNYYKYLLDYIKNKNEIADIIVPSLVGVEDVVLLNLISQLSALYREKGTLAFSTYDNNPALDMVNRNIQTTRTSLLENTDNNIRSIGFFLDDVNKRINRVDAEINKLPATERQLINIERKFNLNDKIYNYLLEKRTEAGIAKASNIADNRILDRARVENAEMVGPKKSMKNMIAIIIGILIPFALIIGIDYFNNKIIDKSDIEKVTTIPLLGTIGHALSDSYLSVIKTPKSPLSESFRAFRTNLQYLPVENKCKIISILSVLSGEGKTFCAINLASIIAMSNKKILLAGFDLRKPKIHRIYNLDNKTGLSTYLIGKSSFEEIIHSSTIENLFIAPSGPVPPNPAELIDSDRMKEFFTEARKKFDFIIIDTPPIAIVTDAILLSKFSDINLFILRQNYSTKNILPLLNDLYKNKEIKNMSLLINDIKVSGYYGYDYVVGSGYSYGYRHEYYGDEPKKQTFKRVLRRFFK